MSVVSNPSVTTGPITGSSKAYRELSDGARVPFRRVAPEHRRTPRPVRHVGPYTDDTAVIDLAAGLPARPGLKVRDGRFGE